jgi:superfamily I DNA/RNA helicase
MTPADKNATGSLDQIGGRDHAITAEYRIYGSPGCGKTTNLSRQVARAVAKYGPEAVLITSFSRAAAAELAGRDLPVGGDRIGTLHSHCYRALGGPEIAEANVEDWNKENPQLAITPEKKHGKLDGEKAGQEDDSTPAKDGDDLLQQLNRFRGLMIAPEYWPKIARDFAEKWTKYKRENGLLDFTDLIEAALRDIAIAPGNPAVLFADEAQDLNRMQLSLIRKWGERANYFIVAGDDDQTIYSFTGATPEAFLDPDIPDDHKIILKQSYRVPEAVHGLANRLIHRVTRRQEKTYLARPARGSVERLTRGSYKSPEYFILKTATEHLERGQSIMFLASCSFMLRPLVKVLRANAIPFWNPYRKANGFWNPIRIGNRGSTANRVLSLLVAHPDYGQDHRPWTHGDLMAWAECLASKGVLRHGAKKKLSTCDVARQVAPEDLNAIFEPAALDSLMEAYEGDSRMLLDWWQSRINVEYFDRAKYPSDVARRRGPTALLAQPRVVVGTIHSVKGGQADVVYLFPDLSQAGAAQYARSGPPCDSVIRLFYVGATRARETLYICQRETGMAVSL